jgi:hypothetical protein
MRALLARERAGFGQGLICNRLGTSDPLPVDLRGEECPAKNSVFRNSGTAFAVRKMTKRTMTYRERSLVKCLLSNLCLNESTAQRHNRIGYWSNVPRWDVPI